MYVDEDEMSTAGQKAADGVNELVDSFTRRVDGWEVLADNLRHLMCLRRDDNTPRRYARIIVGRERRKWAWFRRSHQ
jgi:hypothetical protein